MFKNKVSKYLLTGGMAALGLAAGIGGMAAAQSANTAASTATTNASTSTTVDIPEPGDVADAPRTRGHAPLGGDGVVTSISGTTIVMGEEADEGGASYTIDASKATFTVNGATGTIADVKVGQKIFVQGPLTGTNVAATKVSVGHPGGHMGKGHDDDGDVGEANEPAGSSDASDQ